MMPLVKKWLDSGNAIWLTFTVRFSETFYNAKKIPRTVAKRIKCMAGDWNCRVGGYWEDKPADKNNAGDSRKEGK